MLAADEGEKGEERVDGEEAGDDIDAAPAWGGVALLLHPARNLHLSDSELFGGKSARQKLSFRRIWRNYVRLF